MFKVGNYYKQKDGTLVYVNEIVTPERKAKSEWAQWRDCKNDLVILTKGGGGWINLQTSCSRHVCQISRVNKRYGSHAIGDSNNSPRENQ